MTACASDLPPPPAPIVYVRQQIPPSLLACALEPAVPAAPVTEFAVLVYIAKLRAALLDCRYRLGKVRELVAPPPG